MIRGFLWLIPVPELNILAYDVSTHRTGSLSPIFQRCVESFVTCDFTTLRVLLLGQILVSGQLNAGGDAELIGGRNAVAQVTYLKCIEIKISSFAAFAGFALGMYSL